MMKTTLLSLVSLCGLAASSVLHAEAQTFDFQDPKGVNNVSFMLDAPLESISGSASGIAGTVEFDPENPASISGTIVVDATSLTVTNPVMQEHLHGEGWLNTGKHGQIRFELGNVSKVEKEGRHLTMHATGDFTLHGVTKEITVPVRVTYLPGMLADRTNGAAEGDLLVIRSDFSVNRSDYGIKPGQMTDKVAEEVELRLSIAGAAPRS